MKRVCLWTLQMDSRSLAGAVRRFSSYGFTISAGLIRPFFANSPTITTSFAWNELGLGQASAESNTDRCCSR